MNLALNFVMMGGLAGLQRSDDDIYDIFLTGKSVHACCYSSMNLDIKFG